MVPFFKRLLWDESGFERYSRALVFALAGAAATGQLTFLPAWATPILLALGGLVGAGQKNPPQP